MHKFQEFELTAHPFCVFCGFRLRRYWCRKAWGFARRRQACAHFQFWCLKIKTVSISVFLMIHQRQGSSSWLFRIMPLTLCTLLYSSLCSNDPIYNPNNPNNRDLIIWLEVDCVWNCRRRRRILCVVVARLYSARQKLQKKTPLSRHKQHENTLN